ncbi:hypothetical protein JYT83_00560 [bacterium AH-315-F18]|nr:hypothetical protein [bacterium AH-315-F18]
MDICGPDITAWFAQELEIYRAFGEAHRASWNPFSRLLFAWRKWRGFGKGLLYSDWSFEVWANAAGDGPCGKGAGHTSVWLHDRCIDNSELGNMVAGFVTQAAGFSWCEWALGRWLGNRGAFTSWDKASGDVGFALGRRLSVINPTALATALDGLSNWPASQDPDVAPCASCAAAIAADAPHSIPRLPPETT